MKQVILTLSLPMNPSRSWDQGKAEGGLKSGTQEKGEGAGHRHDELSRFASSPLCVRLISHSQVPHNIFSPRPCWNGWFPWRCPGLSFPRFAGLGRRRAVFYQILSLPSHPHETDSSSPHSSRTLTPLPTFASVPPPLSIMGKAKHNKIPISKPQAPLASPFANLALSGLPEAPEPAKSPEPSPAPKTRRAVLRKEKSGRGGKIVIVIDSFDPPLDPMELESLAKALRKQCGCGGTVREGKIELQGDRLEAFRQALQSHNITARGGSS
jgi:translation initiation factor 1